jgi:hypothetical protein
MMNDSPHENSISRETCLGPRQRPALGRAALVAGGAIALSIALAGCGGGSSTPGVATGSTTTAVGPSTGRGTQAPGLVAYASCMRSHGVPSFPDPTSSAGNTKEAAVRAFKDLSNSQVVAAQTACQRLQPNGGRPSQAQIAQHLSDLLAFARCMRTHGLPNFPDPTSSGQVTHEMLVHQPGVLQDADACVSVTHGALTKAAIARFAAGH